MGRIGYCPTVEPPKFFRNLGGNVNGLTEPNNRVAVGFVQPTLDSNGLIAKDCEQKGLAIVYGKFFLFPWKTRKSQWNALLSTTNWHAPKGK